MTTQPDFRALCVELERECFELYSDMTANMDFNDGYMERMDDLRDRVRAAIGTPPLAPVPMSERMPGPEDCDNQGKCWFFFLLSDDPTWTLEHYTSALCSGRFYRLPHWAIPLPNCSTSNESITGNS
jgi:hypothetical protein